MCYNREMTDMVVSNGLMEYCLIRVEQIYITGEQFRKIEVKDGVDTETEKACQKFKELLHQFLFYTYVCLKINWLTDTESISPEIISSCLDLLSITGGNN